MSDEPCYAYVGPYLRCKRKTEPTEVKSWGCSSPACDGETIGKFCGECGKANEEKTATLERQMGSLHILYKGTVNPFRYPRYADNREILIPIDDLADSAIEVEIASDDFEAANLIDVDRGAAKATLQAHLPKLREIYSEVEFCWGLLTWSE